MPQRGFMCRLGLSELSASVSARKVVVQNDIMGYSVNFVSVRASRSDFTLQISQLFFLNLPRNMHLEWHQLVYLLPPCATAPVSHGKFPRKSLVLLLLPLHAISHGRIIMSPVPYPCTESKRLQWGKASHSSALSHYLWIYRSPLAQVAWPWENPQWASPHWNGNIYKADVLLGLVSLRPLHCLEWGLFHPRAEM